ncbi:hypothetical protein HGM15179_019358 [Zosterops borbonicus]|uniref:Ig-like domain-containing protein n=1 Tax=Zosterops borbonicus TaxID=364589 RepID=A0A8K1D9I7_9PASS|nr:hypothetical protein HGM15179_019358 [Zosterops borbonicus]
MQVTGDILCPPNFTLSLLSDPGQSDPSVSESAHADVQLLCQARGRGSRQANLTWLVNGDVTDLGGELSTCHEEGGANQEVLSGRVNVSRELWEGGATFTCRASHAHLATPLSASASTYCKGSKPSPSVQILPPSLQDLYLSSSPNLTCVASNLKSPRPKFTWSRSGGGALGVATSGPAHRLPNGQYEVRNYLAICAEDWNSGEEFTCRVGGDDVGDTPLVAAIKKENSE